MHRYAKVWIKGVRKPVMLRVYENESMVAFVSGAEVDGYGYDEGSQGAGRTHVIRACKIRSWHEMRPRHDCAVLVPFGQRVRYYDAGEMLARLAYKWSVRKAGASA